MGAGQETRHPEERTPRGGRVASFRLPTLRMSPCKPPENAWRRAGTQCTARRHCLWFRRFACGASRVMELCPARHVCEAGRSVCLRRKAGVPGSRIRLRPKRLGQVVLDPVRLSRGVTAEEIAGHDEFFFPASSLVRSSSPRGRRRAVRPTCCPPSVRSSGSIRGSMPSCRGMPSSTCSPAGSPGRRPMATSAAAMASRSTGRAA